MFHLLKFQWLIAEVAWLLCFFVLLWNINKLCLHRSGRVQVYSMIVCCWKNMTYHYSRWAVCNVRETVVEDIRPVINNRWTASKARQSFAEEIILLLKKKNGLTMKQGSLPKIVYSRWTVYGSRKAFSDVIDLRWAVTDARGLSLA